jgi:hypothetical protein
MMTRHERLEREVQNAEQDLAFTTLWLAQCDDPSYPGAEANREHFLALRSYANDRYSRALKLLVRLPTKPVTLPPPRTQLDLF